MNVHIVPHGRSTAHIKRGLRGHSSVDIVHLLTSEVFDDVGRELEHELVEFGYDVERVLIDAFDLRSVVDTIVSIAKSYKNANIFINITGGTNLVAGAATSSAFFIGATPYYVLEPQDEGEITEELVMTLPAPTQPLTFEVEGLQRKVLISLFELENAGRKEVIMREIGEKLGESPQKISYHISRLEGRGLVEKLDSGRSKNIELTDVGKLYLQWTT